MVRVKIWKDLVEEIWSFDKEIWGFVKRMEIGWKDEWDCGRKEWWNDTKVVGFYLGKGSDHDLDLWIKSWSSLWM